ncbi:DNA-binding MarR family transcriptional regulator [Microbacterium sp. AK009]|nr:DNA-binding MarR family transcriptional regulator [Microbacterium sp. AK009]
MTADSVSRAHTAGAVSGASQAQVEEALLNATPQAMTGALALVGIGTLVRKLLDERLGESGMSVRHLSVLGHVRGRPGMSMAELAQRIGITNQSMHTTVHQLLERGLIEPAGPLSRGRSSALRITPDGTHQLMQALNVVAEVDQIVNLDKHTTSAILDAAVRIAKR